MSSDTNKTIIDSITTITDFAQRVDAAITKLHTDLDKNYDEHTDIYAKISGIQNVNKELSDKINKNTDQHTDIYAKISEIQGVNEELSNKINQVGVDYEFACESSGEENTLILVKKQNNSI